MVGLSLAKPRPFLPDRETGRIVKPRRNVSKSRFGAVPDENHWYRIGVYISLWISACIGTLLTYLLLVS